MELCSWSDACFLTLTYDSEHLPVDAGLHKRDLQLFFKRLRKDLAESDRSMKYYACGEYGDKFGRPHYHVIAFGVNGLKDADLVRSCWPSGEVYIGSAAPESIGYVAGYVQKKLTGDAVANYNGNEAPFQLSSSHLGDDFVHRFALVLHRDMCFKFMDKSYPLCDRHKDMVFSEIERIGHLTDSLVRNMRVEFQDELRVAERHLIQQYNMFKQPSERRLWR